MATARKKTNTISKLSKTATRSKSSNSSLKTGSTRSTSKQKMNINQDDIARLAFELFMSRGGQHGDDKSDWYRAEQLLKKGKKKLS